MSADSVRIDAIATARASKAVRLFGVVWASLGRQPTANEIRTMTEGARHAAIALARVKVASEATWRVVADLAGALDTPERPEALPVASEYPEGTTGTRPADAPLCLIPDCGCDGTAHA